MPRPLLLLLGDSLTEFGSQPDADGWVSLLSHRFSRSADVAQRGMGGYSTQMFLDVVMTALAVDLAMALHPQLVVLWLGANDAALPNGPSSAQHVPLPQYQNNLHIIVRILQATAPQAHLLLMTVPPVDDAVRRRIAGRGRGSSRDISIDRSYAMAREYAQACVHVAADAGVDVLDLFTVLTETLPRESWRMLLSDGLHLSRTGNRVVEQLLVETVALRFPTLKAQLQQWEFPPFDEVLLDHERGTCPVPSSVSSSLFAPLSDSLLASIRDAARGWFGWIMR